MPTVSKSIRWSVALTVFLVVGLTRLSAESIDLAAFDGGTQLPPSSIQLAGQSVNAWKVSPPQKRQLTFEPLGTTIPVSSGTIYVEVTYFDQGYGRLEVTCSGENGQLIRPDKHTRIVFSDSQAWVTAYLRLTGLPEAGITQIQVGLQKDKENDLIISRVAAQGEPWSDGHFQYLLKEAWKVPYAGPTAEGLDNSTLKGKIMVGYQGWFGTPNDPYDKGWVHWGDISRGHFTTDMWPDVSSYPEGALDKACDVKTLSGKSGYLFSPAWPEVVATHFRWMRENKIDGAFVQRFLGGLYAVNGHPEWVLGNVRAAANQEGRIWAVEYDVSGCSDDKLLETLKKDWIWMVDDFGIKKDRAYAHEGGKPVVFIWGLPFPDRKISPATANAVVDFFKNDPTYGGNYVIGGIPSFYRRQNQEWQDHFRKYDGILEWQSRNYASDSTDLKKMGIDYYPQVWPGFSWANLKHLPTGAKEQYTPREGGRFYEQHFSQAVQAGADRLFVGMFDEYDEGTAIMPMSDDSPPTPTRAGTVVKFYPMPGIEEHAMTLDKPRVEFDFDGHEPAQGIPATNFSMSWEGQLVPPSDGSYKLEVEGPADDSWSFFINGKKVVSMEKSKGSSADGSAVVSDPTIIPVHNSIVEVLMTAGQPIVYRLDYTHGTSQGALRLFWESPSIARQEIPPAAFVDAWGRFLTNEGKPSDWWLKLTAEAKDMITGKRAPTDLAVP